MAIPVMVREADIGIEYSDTAIVARWLKDAGAAVTEGEELLEVESAKATVVITAPATGILGAILVASGEEWDIKQPVAHILAPGEEMPAAMAGPAASAAAPPAAMAAQPRADGRQPAPLTSKRRVIAERMRNSVQSAAHVTLTTEANAAALRAAREEWAEGSSRPTPGYKPSHTAIFVKSAARALALHREMNSSWQEDQIWIHAEIDVGVAVDVADGLVVPVVRQADRKDLRALSAEIGALRERAAAGRLKPSEMSGATFTVSNLGMYDVGFFTPIINPPACAILGVGAIKDRPVALADGALAVQPILPLSLAFDHRIVDGATAARFLGAIKQALEQPDLLEQPVA